MEGYYACKAIHEINKNLNIDMPIADMVWEVLYNNASAREAMQALTQILH